MPWYRSAKAGESCDKEPQHVKIDVVRSRAISNASFNSSKGPVVSHMLRGRNHGVSELRTSYKGFGSREVRQQNRQQPCKFSVMCGIDLCYEALYIL